MNYFLIITESVLILKLFFNLFTVSSYFSNVPKLVNTQEPGLLYSQKRLLNATFYLKHSNVKNTDNLGKTKNLTLCSK